jgi:hypothetical protein
MTQRRALLWKEEAISRRRCHCRAVTFRPSIPQTAYEWTRAASRGRGPRSRAEGGNRALLFERHGRRGRWSFHQLGIEGPTMTA